ncbi:hypothetical protein HDU98_004416 [Podochytrium sp. JEL0797]|nr:hypothetical protein HDU98_004416 [Podochytrium sp. JEL0797]
MTVFHVLLTKHKGIVSSGVGELFFEKTQELMSKQFYLVVAQLRGSHEISNAIIAASGKSEITMKPFAFGQTVGKEFYRLSVPHYSSPNTPSTPSNSLKRQRTGAGYSTHSRKTTPTFPKLQYVPPGESKADFEVFDCTSSTFDLKNLRNNKILDGKLRSGDIGYASVFIKMDISKDCPNVDVSFVPNFFVLMGRTDMGRDLLEIEKPKQVVAIDDEWP